MSSPQHRTQDGPLGAFQGLFPPGAAPSRCSTGGVVQGLPVQGWGDHPEGLLP